MAPLKVTLLMYRVFVPVLLAEKVREEFVPKSVKLLVLVAVPCGTLLPFPLKVSVTDGTLVVVNPFATAPGFTQLEVVPVSVKLVRLPLLVPVASLSMVTDVLVPEGIPWLK